MMQEEEDNIFGRCFGLMDTGLDRDGILAYLRGQGLDVIQAMVVTYKLYGLRVGDAVKVLANHPAWQADVQRLGQKPGQFGEWITELIQPDA